MVAEQEKEKADKKVEDKLTQLENKINDIEKNINFLKDLLTHIHSQFQEFKEDVEARKRI
jgi:predicted  nucleic acid-binding Zn-ribbon protein